MSDKETARDLLPCPFCGGSARLWPQGQKGDKALVSCGTCLTSGRKSTPRCVVTAWNTRAARSESTCQEKLLTAIAELQRLYNRHGEIYTKETIDELLAADSGKEKGE